MRNEAYTEDKLECMLEDQTIDFINNNQHNQLSTNKIKLSKIFKWFDNDFKKTQTIRKFISHYSKIQLKEPLEVDYLEYNWDLNDVE